MNSYMVFDIGGTTVKYAWADPTGLLSDTGSFTTPDSGLEELLDHMRRAYDTSRQGREASGVAVSSPGAVDCRRGIVQGISAVPFIHEIPFAERISTRLDGLAVTIENDANCAALGELWKGVAWGKKNMVSVVCGTGIGGAVIIDGKLHRGITNNGGEFGNCLIKGVDGSYRTWSAFTLVKQAGKYSQAVGCEVNGKQLLELAHKEDPLARQLVDEFYEIMAAGIYNIQFTLDTELIVLGGGVSEAPGMIQQIYKKMDMLGVGQRFTYLKPKIAACRFGNQANLYGALYHHLKSRTEKRDGGRHGI